LKKLLDSDWLRAVQFKCNISAKSVTVQITTKISEDHPNTTEGHPNISEDHPNTSEDFWRSTEHLRRSPTNHPQIALVQFYWSLRKNTRAYLFQIALEIIW